MTGDRFPGQARASAALDETRRAVQRRRSRAKRAELRKRRGLLGRNQDDLDTTARAELRALLAEEPQLGVAHGLKERLRRVYEEGGHRGEAAQRAGGGGQAGGGG